MFDVIHIITNLQTQFGLSAHLHLIGHKARVTSGLAQSTFLKCPHIVHLK